MTDRITRLVNRLNKIGIEVLFIGNYPWVYLDTVNGVKVTEKYYGNHGFTAFFLMKGPDFVWTDRRAVFNKIREMVEKK